jgi:hypothetical protein
MNSCKQCNRKFNHFITRRSYIPIIKYKNGHQHFGTANFFYGICKKNHYTKINEKTEVIWEECSRCEEKDKLEKKRRFLEAKMRREKKKVPTFLLKECEIFDNKINSIYDTTRRASCNDVNMLDKNLRLKNEISKHIHSKLKDEMETRIRKEIEKDILFNMKNKICDEIYDDVKEILHYKIERSLEQNIRKYVKKPKNTKKHYSD